MFTRFYKQKNRDLNPVFSIKKYFKQNYLLSYPSKCTLPTERPDGSALFLKLASHSNAIGVLQAIEGTEGTQLAAESDGKCSVKIER